MIKHISLAALSLAALTTLPLPGTTGAAFAQAQVRPCTAGPQCPTSGSSETYECSDEMGYLRRVYEDDLEEIENPLRVAVVPVCEGQPYGVMRADGNAGTLRQVIADNDAMVEALFRKKFESDDVVGIRMTGDESVILYVHPFHN